MIDVTKELRLKFLDVTVQVCSENSRPTVLFIHAARDGAARVCVCVRACVLSPWRVIQALLRIIKNN